MRWHSAALFSAALGTVVTRRATVRHGRTLAQTAALARARHRAGLSTSTTVPAGATPVLALESAFAVPWSDLLPQSPVLSAGQRRSRDEAAELLEGIVVVLAGEADAMNDYDASIRLAHLLADVLDAIDWMAA